MFKHKFLCNDVFLLKCNKLFTVLNIRNFNQIWRVFDGLREKLAYIQGDLGINGVLLNFNNKSVGPDGYESSQSGV